MCYFLPVVVFFFYQYFTMGCCGSCFKKLKNKEDRRRAFNEAKNERNLRFLNAIKNQEASNSGDILLLECSKKSSGIKFSIKDLLNKVLADSCNKLVEMCRNIDSDPEIKRLRFNSSNKVDNSGNKADNLVNIQKALFRRLDQLWFGVMFPHVSCFLLNLKSLTEKLDIYTIVGFILQKLDHLDSLFNTVLNPNVVIKLSLDLRSVNSFISDPKKYGLFEDVRECDGDDIDKVFNINADDYDRFVVEIDSLSVKKYDSSSKGYIPLPIEEWKNIDDKSSEWISQLIDLYVDFSSFCQLYEREKFYVYYRDKKLYFYTPTIEKLVIDLGINGDIEKFDETNVEFNDLSDLLSNLLKTVNQQDDENINLKDIADNLKGIKKRLKGIEEIIKSEGTKSNYDFLCKLKDNVVIPGKNNIDSLIKKYENFKNKNNELQDMYNGLEGKAKERRVNVQVDFAEGVMKVAKNLGDFFGVFLG